MRDDQVPLVKKFTSGSATVEPVELGSNGLWIEGNHVLTWQFGLADTRQIRTRLAGNVLIWVVGNTTYRLEGEARQEPDAGAGATNHPLGRSERPCFPNK